MRQNQKTYSFTFLIFVLLVLNLSGKLYSQISGTVTDASTSKPLSGATVLVGGTASGCITDSSGHFALNGLQEGKITISISYIGYQAQESSFMLKAGDKKNLTIMLARSISEIATVSITGSRSQHPEIFPGRVSVVTRNDLDNLPGITTDDYLQSIAGLNVERPYGISNKSGNVSMRGMNRNVQTLILVDGVPYSLIDGGASSWNRLNPDCIERIEVLKGPASHLYGSNAMGGVVNIITKKPEKTLSGRAKIFYGTYNTYGTNVFLLGKTNKGFYWGTSGFYRRSDGYVLRPDSLVTSSDTSAWLKEGSASAFGGFRFRKGGFIEFKYDFSSDFRSAGSANYEPEGSFNKYDDHTARLTYSTAFRKLRININAFFKKEYYYRQNEGVKKKTGQYTFTNGEYPSHDYGIMLTTHLPLGKHQAFMAGADIKKGALENNDYYRTSTDTVEIRGKLDFYSLFFSDDISLASDRLHISGGARADYVRFHDGYFGIREPSLATSYLEPWSDKQSSADWIALSPHLGLQYIFPEKASIYLSWAHGFRPPTISDLCKTGDVEKGFKIANPGLRPEHLDNFEAGGNYNIGKFIFEPSLYYSIGKDFQYFVARGDSMTTTGDSPKPVIVRENIKRIDIKGAELAVRGKFLKHFYLITAYTYTLPLITDYSTDDNNSKDLNGKFLIEVPKHLVFTSLTWENKWVALTMNFKYRDRQWADDENTVRMAERYIFDTRLVFTPSDYVAISLTVQNILNRRYTDAKGLLTPGRFLLGEFSLCF